MKGKNKDFDLGEPVNLPPEFTIEESMLQEQINTKTQALNGKIKDPSSQ